MFADIKPHYRSEGPRQGLCVVFGGVLILLGVLILYIYYCGVSIAELALNFINMSPHYRWERLRNRVECFVGFVTLYILFLCMDSTGLVFCCY